MSVIPIKPIGSTNLPEATAPKPRMDPELQVMAKVDRILSGLDPSAIRRVLLWIVTKHCNATVKITPDMTQEQANGKAD